MPIPERLRDDLDRIGVNILLPIGEVAFDAATAAGLRLRDLFSGGRSAVILGTGGRRFFELYRAHVAAAAPDPTPHPLDRFTRSIVTAVVNAALEGSRVDHRIFFPFDGETPALPFQRLGRAAGLGAPGPLGLQIHPQFGPWWAYRALVLTEADLMSSGPGPGDGCAGCDAPCVVACPAQAVQRSGFSVIACHARRLETVECQRSCIARIRCIRGPEHRYSEEQLGFHMAASMPRRH